MISTASVQSPVISIKPASANTSRGTSEYWGDAGTTSLVFSTETTTTLTGSKSLLTSLQKSIEFYMRGGSSGDAIGSGNATHLATYDTIMANRDQYPDEAFKIRTDFADGTWMETEILANDSPSTSSEATGYNPADKLNGILIDFLMEGQGSA